MDWKSGILGAGALLMAAGAQAATIAYDDFATDRELDGSSGGSGFSTNWYDGSYTISGGIVSGTGNALRGLESTLGSNGTVWVSFDMERTSGDSYGGLSLFEGSTERLIIGDRYKAGVWCLDHAGTAYSDAAVDGGIKTAVAKITLGAGSSSIVELWVGTNNTDDVECSGLADATVAAGTLANVDTVRIGAGFIMDFADLILADSIADVPAVLGGDNVYSAFTAGLWSESANWSGGVPASTDAAVLDLGADVRLEGAAAAASLVLKVQSGLTVAFGGSLICSNMACGGSTALEIADGGTVTVSSDVSFSDTDLTIGVGTSSGVLSVGGVLDLSGAALTVEGAPDVNGRTIVYAAGGIANEFSNYADAAFVLNDGTYNYYIHYETNALPHSVVISTNGVQGSIELPPRPSVDYLVGGYDQRYMAYDFDEVTGVWTDTVTSAQNAAADVVGGFSITTNTPNGRPAVVNDNNGYQMTFTRASAISETGFTIQAVIRLDSGNSDSRQGPFSLADGGWGGVYMGARAGETSKVRAGNIGSEGKGYQLEGEAGNSLSTNVWGVYTLIVDPTVTTQLVASFDLLVDGSNGFTITDSVTSTNTVVGRINTSGGLFSGERGALSNTADWQGAIADLVVYNYVLSDSEIAANLNAFQTLYLDDIVYETSVGKVAMELISGGAEVVVTWETSQYGTFALESTESLSVPFWSDVETGIPGTGGDVSVTTTVSDAKAFYRAYIED